VHKVYTVLVVAILISSLLFASPFLSYGAQSQVDATTNVQHQDLYTLQQSKPLVARTGAWQTWNDRLHVKPGQDKRKLLLTFVNGAEGRKQMTGINVTLSGEPFATIKDFDASGKLTRELNGPQLKVGNIPIAVQGFGPSGARVVWKLLTEEIVITAVRPNPFKPGEKVSVQGRNFSEHPEEIKVTVGGKAVKLTSARRNELEMTIPPHFNGGRQDVVVTIGSVKSNVYVVGAKITPTITWIDLLAAPPGQPVVITGTGFSDNPADNVVTFGSIKAHVSSATETSITCEVPDIDFPRWHVPIKVITHGIPSRDNAEIHIDMRVVPNEGIPMH
jgi:IPT/TIG domain